MAKVFRRHTYDGMAHIFEFETAQKINKKKENKL